MKLNLENFSTIRRNPYLCLSNLALNEHSVMAGELELINKGQMKFIIDATTFENGRSLEKIGELEKYGNIATGMTYIPNYQALLKDQITKEARIVLSEGRVYNKIVHEAFGSENCFSGLGPISFTKLKENESFEKLILPGVLKFMRSHNSPLVVDLEGKVIQNDDLDALDSLFPENTRERVLLSNFNISTIVESKICDQGFKVMKSKVYEGFEAQQEAVKRKYKLNIPIIKFCSTGLEIDSLAHIVRNLVQISQSSTMLSAGY